MLSKLKLKDKFANVMDNMNDVVADSKATMRSKAGELKETVGAGIVKLEAKLGSNDVTLDVIVDHIEEVQDLMRMYRGQHEPSVDMLQAGISLSAALNAIKKEQSGGSM